MVLGECIIVEMAAVEMMMNKYNGDVWCGKDGDVELIEFLMMIKVMIDVEIMVMNEDNDDDNNDNTNNGEDDDENNERWSHVHDRDDDGIDDD